MTATLWGILGVLTGILLHLIYALQMERWLKKEDEKIGNVAGKLFLISHTYGKEGGCALYSMIIFASYIGVYVFDIAFFAFIFSLFLLEMLACSAMNFIIKNQSLTYSTQNLTFAYVLAFFLTLLEILATGTMKGVVMIIIAISRIVVSVVNMCALKDAEENTERFGAVMSSAVIATLAFMM